MSSDRDRVRRKLFDDDFKTNEEKLEFERQKAIEVQRDREFREQYEQKQRELREVTKGISYLDINKK